MDALNRRLDAIRAKLDRVKKSVHDSDKAKTSVQIFESYLDDIDDSFHDYKARKEAIYTEMSRLEDANEKTSEEIDKMFMDYDVKFSEIDQSFVMVRAELKYYIANLTPKTVANPIVPQFVMPPRPPKIQLPQVKLPSFSGKYEDYTSFIEKFRLIIHNNNEIPTIQKYQILLECLDEKVRKGFDYLEFNEQNYSVVLEKLNHRYNNKKMSVDNHISGIVNIKAMNRESASELQRILDNTVIHLAALKTLGVEVDHWDEIIVYLVAIKLDTETRKKWEETVDKSLLPQWDDMRIFLQKRCNSLESVELAVDYRKKPEKTQKDSKTVKSMVVSSESGLCVKCGSSHDLTDCRAFIELPLSKKFEFVKSKRMCFNCLKSDHLSKNCSLNSLCSKCPSSTLKKHSTLLHSEKKSADETNSKSEGNSDSPKTKTESESKSKSEPSKTSLNCIVNDCEEEKVVLMTALVYLYGKNDQPYLARALLDSGSEASFITTALAGKLRLSQEKCKTSIIGFYGNKSSCKGKVNVYIRSRHHDYGNTLQLLMVDEITKNIPGQNYVRENWSVPSNIVLADPQFNESSPIDVLLGAEIFVDLLLNGRLKLKIDLPYLIETQLGWVWSGRLIDSRKDNNLADEEVSSCVVTNEDLSRQISKFFEVEYQNTNDTKTLEEVKCETKFLEFAKKVESGRYEVGMMIKDNPPVLGESKAIALSRLNSLWKKLDRDKQLKILYCGFMREYLELGHMQKIDDLSDGKFGSYYIPHHGVLKPESTTTKLRVVFNASQKTSNGVSLNDILMNGGFVQKSLLSVMLKHRLFKFAFSVDIVKMYRQLKMNHNFTSLLRILWKWEKDDPVEVYELKTVTYGTKDAPFNAMRTLNKIAEDNLSKFPLAARVLLKGFYVDNGLYGADSVDEAVKMIHELIDLMKLSGMDLHKWSTNDSRLIKGIPSEQQETFMFDENENEMVKVLGTLWKPKCDVYSFIVNGDSDDSPLTKRKILSEVARIYDIVGFLSPVIVKAKILLQSLWTSQFDWDDDLPLDICAQWLKFRKDLELVEKMAIPRFINPYLATRHELIGFSDASKLAYGMCIYLRSICKNGDSSMFLIYSKSRVTPISGLTIPRAEMEAGVLLAEGVRTVLDSIDLNFERIRLFSDNKAFLSWLRTDPLKLQVYVANRVLSIKKFCGNAEWNYVPTKLNPADLVSRGVGVQKLIESDLWWLGPAIESLETNLTASEDLKKLSGEDLDSYQMELKKDFQKLNCLVATEPVSSRYQVFSQYSNSQTVTRIMGWVLRFIDNCRRSKAELERKIDSLSTIELKNAQEHLVKIIQMDSFTTEYDTLKKNGTLSPSHPLKSLNLILIDGIIRVGGRLTNSKFNFDKKHQMLLPKDHQFTEMLVRDMHVRHLHVGPQGLLFILREKFWLVNGRSHIRKILHKCIKCFKVNPRSIETFMGDLPNYRVESSYPFYHTGVDCGGYFMMKVGGIRSKVMTKAWFVIFVCMSTKAIHLDLIVSMSSEAFKDCLRRFICRRGKPHTLHSDNGTNFIGCKRDLKELKELFNKQNSEKVSEFCSNEGINWTTIPPRASHFGGEWEAGVKSVKYHLKRIAGNASLTYEETLTLLIQIEAVLNSRPLYAMSTDPNDFEPITPAHFLIGRPFSMFPEPELIDMNPGRLTRFERITQIRQHFWKRFSLEYVTSLQNRTKWFRKKPEIKIGQLVMLKDENLPSYCWRTGRIVKLYPGKDNVVRVVLIKMPDGQEFKRDSQKISILPLENEVTE